MTATPPTSPQMPGLLALRKTCPFVLAGLSIGGLIEGISNCKELVEWIVSEAVAIIKARLSAIAA